MENWWIYLRCWTGGTLTGVGNFLKEKPDIKIFLSDPCGQPYTPQKNELKAEGSSVLRVLDKEGLQRI